MRVIAGKAKGHRLKAPKTTATRPATDLVRGAIFSILENRAEDWSQVLDLYSGSGALGIEALSRGAGWVDFVEHNPQTCSIIKENLEKTKFIEQAHIYCWDVAKAISVLDKEYNIILVDPPYAGYIYRQHINQAGKFQTGGSRYSCSGDSLSSPFSEPNL